VKSITVSNHELISLMIEHLNNGQEVSFKINGNSMLPFFKHQKTVVTLKKFDVYKPYDVVLFLYDGTYILHRIINIEDGAYYLRGDGAYRIEKVTLDNIYGKVIHHETNGKTTKNYEKKVKWWLCFTPIRKLLLKFVRS
jgi:hypothetical protein